jgi:hypothetical protein
VNAQRPMIALPVAPRSAVNDPQVWLVAGIALGLFLVAAVIAWRRARRAGNRPPRAFARIVWVAAAFALPLMLVMLPSAMRRLSDSQKPALLLVAGALTIAAIPVVAALDAIARLFRPARNRDWLVIALVASPLLYVAALAIAAFVMSLPYQFLPRQLIVLPIGWTVALIWWSWLPAPGGHATTVTDVFE